MVEGDTIAEDVLKKFLAELEPCIQRGDLDACAGEATRLAGEVGIGADELLALSVQMGNGRKHEFAYVLAFGAVDGLDGSKKAKAYYYAGVAAQSFGNVGKAEVHYLKAIEGDPKYALAHYNYALLLNGLNRKVGAEVHYLKTIEADPNYAAAHYNYALLLSELNRTEGAEIHYLKAIEIDPKLAAAHNNYALLLSELNRTDEAEIHYLKAIEVDPNYATAHNNYANLLRELNRKHESEVYYLKAIEADPNYAVAHLNYAILLEELNRKDESESHYLKAIEFDSKLAIAHNNYANCLRERGKLDEAEKEVSHALQIAQDDSSLQDILPYAHGTLGDIFADEDYYKDAEREYKKALDKSSSMDKSALSEIHNNLGWVYAKMRKCKKARGEFKKARVLDPLNIKAKRNIRAFARIRSGGELDISVIQIFLGSVLLVLLIYTYVLFFITKLSETSFVMQSTIFLLLIFVLLDIIDIFIFGKNGIEVGRSTGHMRMPVKTIIMDAKSKLEDSQLP